MSDGLSLLTAMIETGSVQTLRSISQEQFLDEELDVYNFVRRHFRRYSTLPAINTVEAELGLSLPQVEETVGYYYNKVVDRQLYGHIRDHFEDLRNALRDNDMGLARTSISSMHQASRSVVSNGHVVNLRAASQMMIDAYDDAHQTPGMTGVPTGWEHYDTITGGHQKGDLVSIVARLGVGKTNILLKQADHAWETGYNVLVVTTEMPVPQMTRRLMGLRTGVNPDLVRKGILSTWARRRLGRLVNNLVNTERFHFFAAGMKQSVEDIDALVNELAPDIIFIDGAYLLRPANDKYRSKQERVPEVFDSLRSMALQSDRPFVATSQFSRMSGKRGKEGSIETIAFSDAIAQNSSLVIGLKEGKPPHQATRRILEFMKGREGEAGEVTINYQFTPVNLTEMNPEEVQAEEVDLDWMAA